MISIFLSLKYVVVTFCLPIFKNLFLMRLSSDSGLWVKVFSASHKFLSFNFAATVLFMSSNCSRGPLPHLLRSQARNDKEKMIEPVYI